MSIDLMAVSRAGAVLALLAAAAAWAVPGPVILQPVVSGLSAPLEIVNAGDGSNRLFVVEQAGRVRVVRDGRLLPAPFLDIRASVLSGGEQGLLGLAFHPAYPANGRFFVYYNRASNPADGGSEIVIAE